MIDLICWDMNYDNLFYITKESGHRGWARLDGQEFSEIGFSSKVVIE